MEQTNRTILFEEINADAGDLLMLIGDTKKRKSMTDEEIAKIHEKLAVSSFEEFIQKFSPSVYMLLDTEQHTVNFSQEHLGNGEEQVRLDTGDSLFSMLLYLMDAKQKKKYVLTGFGDMLDNLIPRENANGFVEERNEIWKELAKKKPEHMNWQKNRMIKLAETYDDGVFLLTVFLRDVCGLLHELEEGIKPDKGILDDKGRMQIRVIKKSAKYRKTALTVEKKYTARYREMVERMLDQVCEKRALRNRTLLRDCMLLPALMIEREFATVQKQYEKYSKLYIDVLKKFWMTAKPVMETMLGVREYFAQYQKTDGMKPVLVVANFRIVDLLHEKNREKLDIYLSTVNSKSSFASTIWYAIVPNMISEEKNKGENIRERFPSRHERYSYRRNDIEELTLLLELLAKHRIMSFLSMASTEENTFSGFAKYGIDRVNDALSVFDKMDGIDYLVPCFPNFIVVSREEASLAVGKNIEYDDLVEKMSVGEERNVWLDEIGIEAAFVAAGLVAACQCPQYLKKYYRRGVNDALPGVSYRFSEADHALITTSDMLSETIEFSEELETDAVARSRGLLFGQKKGKMVVLTDRVYSYHKGNPLLLSMIQTISYIERMIQYETQDFKKNLIHQFFQKRPGSIITQWYNRDGIVINPILREEEELEYKIDESDSRCTFTVRFQNSDLIRRETVSIFKE